MDGPTRRILADAALNHEMVTVWYNKPKVGVIQRHVRPHEISVNRAGRAVIWGTDSVHGPDQIHAFRLDRVMAVKESKRPTSFTPAPEVTQYLRSYDYGARPSNVLRPGDPKTWKPSTNPANSNATTPHLPVALRTKTAQPTTLPARPTGIPPLRRR